MLGRVPVGDDGVPLWNPLNPVGTETVQSMGMPDASFRPGVFVGGGTVPVSQETLDRFRQGSEAVYNQAALLGGVPAASEAGAARVLGSVRNPLNRPPERLPMDMASRMDRARALGFDTSKTLYHSTPYDFTEFVPNTWRGASYFAETPEGAMRGAGSGGMEHPALSGPTTKAEATGQRIIPVHVAGKIWGRDPLPADWLPEQLTYGQYKDIVNGKDVIAPEGFTKQQLRSINIERQMAARKYYTEAVPESEYHQYTGENENNLPMKLEKPPVADPFGYESIEGGDQPSAFAPSGSMSPAERRDMLRRLGYSGWVVNDEGGRSVAIADPSKIRAVTAAFDPAKAGAGHILYGVGGLLGAGLAAGAQGGDQ